MTNGKLPHKSLLDVGDLPVAQLALIARRESIRPRDAYQAHKWFARRLATTARSLIAAAVTPHDEDFWDAYYGGASCEGLTVLDPFMGGGVMVLEASRFGADVFGTDVEPVATVVSDFQGRLRDLPDLSPWMEKLAISVGRTLAPYYRSFDDEGTEERLLHAFWVQHVSCGECGHVYDAHPKFRLASSAAQKRQWVSCCECSAVIEAPIDQKVIRCRCGAKTAPDEGRVIRGSASCPRCGHSEPLIEMARRTKERPLFRLFAVETIPSGHEKRYVTEARRIRSASARDASIYDAARKKLEKEQKANPEFFVSAKIPSRNRFDNRLVRYGYRDYAELHNARQTLHLGLLAREIAKIDGVSGEALRIAFSDHLTTNNLMCAYAEGWRRLTPLFSIRAYRHIARPVELNPWLTKNGRGTFPNAVRSITRAVASVLSESEPLMSGGNVSVVRRKPGRWDIRCCDASDLDHIEDGSVDLVLTDPPYFDYIAYSELGHFFAPWMSRLGLIRSRRKARGFPSGQLASKKNLKARDLFTAELAERLKEVVRVCKPEARIVFTYQSKADIGWLALGNALAAAGIRPLQAWPMFSDTGSGLHKHPNSISWDCVLHCDLHGQHEIFSLSDVAQEAGHTFVAFWREALSKAGSKLTCGDEANLFYAGALVAALGAGAHQPASYRRANQEERDVQR